MDVIFDQLEEIIDQYFFDEKLFVVPSHRDGILAIQGLAKRKKAVINAKVVTFQDLALEQVKGRNLAIVPWEVGVQYIYEALTQLKKENKLLYFQDAQFTPSFCQKTYQALLDLKYAKVGLENFPFAAFIKKEKAEDIYKIFQLYERKLKQENYFDQADVLRIAISNIKVLNNPIYIFFPHEAYDLLEKEFFLALTRKSMVIPVEQPKVQGLEPLPEMIPIKKEITTNHPLGFIFDLENGIQETPLSFTLTAAINEDEEIKQVFQKLRKQQIPFDQTVIYYTNQRPYVESILRLMNKLNIPVTFAEGIPADLTKPGKFIKGLIRWIRDEFRVSHFITMLREGVIASDCLPMKRERMIQLLKECGIVFGKQRYLQKIAEKTSDDYDQYTDEYECLYEWFSRFFSFIPAAFGFEKVNYGNWLFHVKTLLQTYANAASRFDRSCKNQLIEAIEEIAPFVDKERTFSEALMFTEQWLLSLTVGASLPEPRHIHLSPYRIGLYIDRPNVFIVGMDNNRFPGRMKEDPLLLDRERRKIHPEMTLEKELIKRNLYLFIQLLLTTKDHLQLSFPFMDTVENRMLAPSHLFLQLYRYQKQNPELTGQDLLDDMKKHVHFVKTSTDDMIHPSDWLVWQVWQEKELDEVLLKGRYENIIQAFNARQARNSEQITEYDGLIGRDAAALDPRTNDHILVSASKLERLGACPYSYFLMHILKVENDEETPNERYKWLDALTRGNILHEVFEIFYKELTERQEKPKFEQHLTELIEICDHILANEKELNPPPSEMVYELERMELLESCSLFLKAEEEASEEGEPLFFEYTFGLNGKEPAIIDLPDGSKVSVSGIIDRIDRLKDGTYSIIDYKTGSTYGFGEKNYFHGGRKLQHTLYALAFEKLFESDGYIVSTSVYSFPTVKGQGERIYRKQSNNEREQFIKIINHLCDYFKEGHFPYTDTTDDCKYCEFQRICNRHTYSEASLMKKQQDPMAKGWQALMEVRRYD